MKKRISLPLGFFIVLLYIFYRADTADYNFAFRVVGYIPYGDKIMHAILYGIMTMLLNFGLKYKKFYNLQLGAIIVFTFAVLEECSQYYIPSRTFDVYDILADFIGIILFSLYKFKSRIKNETL